MKPSTFLSATALAHSAAFAAAVPSPGTSSSIPVCSSSMYKSHLSSLSTYAPAESYCSSHYPVAPVTETSVATRFTTITDTRIAYTVVPYYETSTVVTSDPSSTTTKTVSETVTVYTTLAPAKRGADNAAATAAAAAAAAAGWAAVTRTKDSSYISTLCSCIEKPSTTTTTYTETHRTQALVTITDTGYSEVVVTAYSTEYAGTVVTKTTTKTLTATPRKTD